MNYEFKGTPKEHWQYAGGDNASVEINIGVTTASVCRWDKNTGIYVMDREEMEANARLIASAPLLLEACIEALELVDDRGVAEQVEKAIHQALNMQP